MGSACYWRAARGEPRRAEVVGKHEEVVGLPHALAGLPGTVGWRGRPRPHALRCAPCQVITLRYGAERR